MSSNVKTIYGMVLICLLMSGLMLSFVAISQVNDADPGDSVPWGLSWTFAVSPVPEDGPLEIVGYMVEVTRIKGNATPEVIIIEGISSFDEITGHVIVAIDPRDIGVKVSIKVAARGIWIHPPTGTEITFYSEWSEASDLYTIPAAVFIDRPGKPRKH